MPDLTLTAEHEQLRKATRDFAQREIVPIAAAHDESGEFPLRTVNMMGKLGLMGIEVPYSFQSKNYSKYSLFIILSNPRVIGVILLVIIPSSSPKYRKNYL